jgi:DNA polymerase III delta subunit
MVDSQLKRVYVVTGMEPLLVREAVGRLKEAAGASESDAFDLLEVDGGRASASEILNSVGTTPFLAERRTVIVSRANRLAAAEAETLCRSLASLPQTALLILVFEPTDDPRKPSNGDRALVAEAKKLGEHIDCAGFNRTAFTQELKRRAVEKGAKLAPDGVTALGEVTSHFLTDAVAELDKCLLYAEGAPITREIVLKVAASSREYKVFQLLDAVCAGKLGPALANLKYLLSEASSPQEAAMRSLLPMLHRQLRMLWQAKACLDEKIAPTNAAHLLPQQHNLASANEYARDQAVKLAGRLSFDQISNMTRTLLETDMRLKGQLAAAGVRETLERMLAELTLIASAR